MRIYQVNTGDINPPTVLIALLLISRSIEWLDYNASAAVEPPYYVIIFGLGRITLMNEVRHSSLNHCGQNSKQP